MAPLIGLESGGLAILEAMASGLPVVASPLGAVQDLIDDGEDGLLVAATRIPDFADALHRLLHDAAAREAIGEAARTRVAQRHGITRSLARLESLYEQVARAQGKAA
jgi:glycosyltransferase involved in cell wall biosynthesis